MLTIRAATIEDVPLLRELIGGLAEFEKEPHAVKITVGELARDGFGASPRFRALIAEWDRKPAGYALFFPHYSTWRGPGLFLEDLFIRSDFRGRGVGKALLAEVARIAMQEGCVLLRWEVLDWNQPAIDLYKALGAEFSEGWRSMSLMGDALRKLAGKAST